MELSIKEKNEVRDLLARKLGSIVEGADPFSEKFSTHVLLVAPLSTLDQIVSLLWQFQFEAEEHPNVVDLGALRALEGCLNPHEPLDTETRRTLLQAAIETRRDECGLPVRVTFGGILVSELMLFILRPDALDGGGVESAITAREG